MMMFAPNSRSRKGGEIKGVYEELKDIIVLVTLGIDWLHDIRFIGYWLHKLAWM